MTYTRRSEFLPFTRPMVGQDGAPSAIERSEEREHATRCRVRSGR